MKKKGVIKKLFSIKDYVILFRDFLVFKNLTEEFDNFVKERRKNYEKDIENFNFSID